MFIERKKHFIYHCCYDKGESCLFNPDSLLFRSFMTTFGPVAIACISSGFGTETEEKSVIEFGDDFVVRHLALWFEEEAIPIINFHKGRNVLKYSLIREMNIIFNEIKNNRAFGFIPKGAYVSILVLYSNNYLVYHFGESRIYKLNSNLKILTCNPFRSNVDINQISNNQMLPRIQIKYGKYRKKDAFILCSSDFYRTVSNDVLKALFCNKKIFNNKKIPMEILEHRMESCRRKVCEKEKWNFCTALYIRRGN